MGSATCNIHVIGVFYVSVTYNMVLYQQVQHDIVCFVNKQHYIQVHLLIGSEYMVVHAFYTLSCHTFSTWMCLFERWKTIHELNTWYGCLRNATTTWTYEHMFQINYVRKRLICVREACLCFSLTDEYLALNSVHYLLIFLNR